MTMRFGRCVGTEVVNMDRVKEGAKANAVQHAKMSGARDALLPKGKVAQAADEERADPLTDLEKHRPTTTSLFTATKSASETVRQRPLDLIPLCERLAPSA